VFELEQDESRAGDAGDGGGVEADSAQGLEGDLEQGVGAFGDTVYAPDDLVERLLVLGELAALWLLDRVAEAGAGVLVAQVGQGGQVQGGGEAVEGVDQAVGTGAGDVVFASRTDLWISPTSNGAGRDLRPAKTQQKISGRLRSEDFTRHRYAIRGYISTAPGTAQICWPRCVTPSPENPGCPLSPATPESRPPAVTQRQHP
jgi:hypothetical protein